MQHIKIYYTMQKLLGHWTDEKKHGIQTFELTFQWNYDAIHFFLFQQCNLVEELME